MDNLPNPGRGIRFGDDWRQRIQEGIRQSSHMLALLSAHSSRKPGVCREEVALALGPLKSYVYTILVQPVSEVCPPLILSQRQWLDMSDWRERQQQPGFEDWFDEQFAQVVRALRDKSNFSGEMDELQRTLNPLSQISHLRFAERGFVGREWLLGRLGAGWPPVGAPPTPDSEPLGAIERWAISDPHKRVFLLCADPGWGKSAVIARLAHAQRARVLAVHFCRHDEEYTRQAARVIRSIAYQMATQLQDYRSRLLEVVRLNPSWESASASDLFCQLIEEPLAHLIDGGRSAAEPCDGHDAGQYQRRLIVIDALDECVDADGKSELLDVLSKRFRALPDWLGLLVSSRREQPVIERFRGFGTFELNAFDQHNEADLRLYAREWLDRLPGLSKLPMEQRTRALDSICAASKGNFLYLRQLEYAVAQAGVVTLEEIVHPEQLPADLGAIYGRWLSRKIETCECYENQVLPLLELMAAAPEPLPESLLEPVLRWDRRTQLRATRFLGSLIRSENGCLLFFHKSLLDWLLNEKAAGDWFVERKAGHRQFARALGAQWEMAQAGIAQQSGPDSGPFFEALEPDARRYALRHLPHHLLDAGEKFRRAKVLTDFAFAMQRCGPESLEWFLQDYLQPTRELSDSPLACWTDAICRHAHELRGSSPSWPARRALLHLALEHGDDSHLTSAAQTWMDLNRCNWPWMRRTDRPQQFRSGQEKWKERLIVLGNSDNHESGNVTSLMTVRGLVVRWAPTPLAACALVGESLSMVRVFDLGTGAVQGQVRLPSGKISGLSLTSDGRRLLVHMESGVALEGHFTELETLREHLGIERMGQPEPRPEVAFLSQPQRWVRATIAGIWMVACADGSIWRWTEGAKDNPRRINAPGPKVHALAITPDGNVAVSAGEGREISFWRGEKRIAQVGGHSHRATHACICDDATQAVTAGQDGTLIVWNLKELAQSSGCAFRSEITALREFADLDCRRHAISGDLKGALRLHTTLGTGESGDHTWQAHTGRVRDLAVTPSAIHAISAGDGPQGSAPRTGGSVAVWDITSRACVARYESTRKIWALAVSPCGKHLAAATDDRRLLVWDLASVLRDSSFESGSRREIETPDKLRALVFSETNHLFAAGDTSGEIYSWSVGGDGVLAQSFSMAHGQASASCLDQGDGAKQTGAYALALSSCGHYLACGGRGRHRAISIWKTAAPAELVSVLFANRAGSLRGTHSLAFVRDTKQLWSANWDGSVARWDWSERQGRCLLYQPAADVSVMVASASGEHLLLGTAQGEVRDMKLVNPDLLLAGLPYV